MGAGARVGSAGPPHRLTGTCPAPRGHPPGWAASPSGRRNPSQHLPQLRAGGSPDCQCLGGGGRGSPGTPPCDGVTPNQATGHLWGEGSREGLRATIPENTLGGAGEKPPALEDGGALPLLSPGWAGRSFTVHVSMWGSREGAREGAPSHMRPPFLPKACFASNTVKMGVGGRQWAAEERCCGEKGWKTRKREKPNSKNLI